MEELDLLKKDWNKEPTEKKLSAQDIYPMLYKKSSSIVKTLFYISIAELAFWMLISILPLFLSAEYKKNMESIYTDTFLFTGLTIFGYVIILLFIYLLYKSYKSISTTDNAKKLMANILKTRKVIKYYVLYNLVMGAVSLIISTVYNLNNNSEAIESVNKLGENGYIVFIGIMILFALVFLVVLWLFYRLIYGLLLKRLNRNYRELKKLDL